MSTLHLALPAPRRAPVRGPVAAALVALIAVACSPASTPTATGSPGPSSPPSAVPSASPSDVSTTGAIEHKTGATDVILRIESGGGFVPIDFLATQAPTFTLYGDGVIVFQPKVEAFPQPDAGGVTKGVPWRTAKLDEGQIQELLQFALGPGGLGGARETYMANGVADAPSTIFTVHAGGLDKTVSVNALSEETQPGPDAVARAAFLKLASRLQDFDEGGRIATDVYVPDRYRGVLIEREAQPGVEPLAWPWTDIPFAEFKEGPQDGSGPTTFPHRTLTVAETAALKLDGIEGGAQGIAIKASDGKIYGLVLRPLLADETE
ncbi:MAG TPA: hypothetical protein VFJ71_03005 [Candidatus Limnocylindrales bacterium]|nr:hypothetical protein [Candidatus Limnocylindrales bacterium]